MSACREVLSDKYYVLPVNGINLKGAITNEFYK